MVDVPDRYGPLTIGRDPYVVELSFNAPYVFAFGFDQPLGPEDALERLSGMTGEWEYADPEYVSSLSQAVSEYRFVRTDSDEPMTPQDLDELINDSEGSITYAVPVFSAEDSMPAPFTMVPNHVVVSSSDLSFVDMADFDELAGRQNFYPLKYRDAVIGERSRRIYSSLVDAPAFSRPDRFTNYEGEPGPALWLIDAMVDRYAATGVDVVAEPDWYTANPNDLGTPATVRHRPPTDDYPAES